MNRVLDYDFPSPPMRVKIAGALAAGALALMALDAGLKWQSGPMPAPVAVVSAHSQRLTTSPHNLTYYPEQLAALTSLASFEPKADKGAIDTSSAGAAVKPPPPSLAPGEGRPIRRAETSRPVPASASVVAPKIAETLKAVETVKSAAADKSFRILGMAVPGSAEVSDRVSSMRDGAAQWSEAVRGLGGKVAGFWR